MKIGQALPRVFIFVILVFFIFIAGATIVHFVFLSDLPLREEETLQKMSVLPPRVEVTPSLVAPTIPVATPALTPKEPKVIDASPTPAPTKKPPETPSQIFSPPAPPAPTVPPEEQPKVFIITIESGGFKPTFLTIKAGDTVQWVNKDTKLHWPASDPHPTHTGLPGFDPLADLSPGETFSYTFNQVGAFSYHDHTQAVVNDIATMTGAIRVLARE